MGRGRAGVSAGDSHRGVAGAAERECERSGTAQGAAGRRTARAKGMYNPKASATTHTVGKERAKGRGDTTAHCATAQKPGTRIRPTQHRVRRRRQAGPRTTGGAVRRPRHRGAPRHRQPGRMAGARVGWNRRPRPWGCPRRRDEKGKAFPLRQRRRATRDEESHCAERARARVETGPGGEEYDHRACRHWEEIQQRRYLVR